MTKIAIIGAGLSGLVAARDLTFGSQITVFDKSRGLGGRLATRYADCYEFDHGCQYITAHSAEFKRFLEGLLHEDVLNRWNARFAEIDDGLVTRLLKWGPDTPHYVASMRMNKLGLHLAQGLEVIREAHITGMTRKTDGWHITDHSDTEHGPFDWVITATPAEQATQILPDVFTHQQSLQSRKMKACFTLMLGFETPLPTDWDAALVKGANISWVAVNNSKPSRPDSFSIVINSTNTWAEKFKDDDRNWIRDYLLSEAMQVTKLPLHQADYRALHLWRYANIESQTGSPASYIDHENQLAAIGDWCVKGRAEGAFKSGKDVARQLLPLLEKTQKNLLSLS